MRPLYFDRDDYKFYDTINMHALAYLYILKSV